MLPERDHSDCLYRRKVAALGMVAVFAFSAFSILAGSTEAETPTFVDPLQEPELWSRYDEAAGTTASDSSGNGYTGELIGVSFSKYGAFGNCVYSNGDHTDCVNYGNVLGITGDITISCWVNTDSTRIVQWLVTKVYGAEYVRTYCLYLYYESGFYNVEFKRGNSDGTNWLLSMELSDAFTPDGQWHFIAVRHDTSAGSYGIRVDDGAWGYSRVHGTGIGTATPTSASLQVGNMNSDGMSLIGYVDDVRIWSGCVADDVIDDAYNGDKPELLSKYDEAAGTTASDSSGNGYTGELEGVAFSPDGAYGNCVYSNGDNSDCVDYGDVLGITGDITMSCWVKTTSTRYAQWLVTKSWNTGYGGGPYTLSIGYDSGFYDVYFRRSNSDGTNWLLSIKLADAFTPDDQWHFVAVRHDTTAGSYGIRVDDGAWGVTTVWSDEVGTAFPTSAPLQVGNMNSGGGGSDRSLEGYIDDVWIWDEYVSDCVIDHAYIGGPTVPAPPTLDRAIFYDWPGIVVVPFTPGDDGGSEITEYWVYRAMVKGNQAPIYSHIETISTPCNLVYEDTNNIQLNKKYYYYFTAWNAIGESTWSNVVWVRTNLATG